MMNVKTEFIVIEGEDVLVKLEGEEVTADQKPEMQSYGLPPSSSRTKQKRIKIRIKSPAPKCQRRGRKKQQPVPVHSFPIPIQPKIFPSSLPVQLFSVSCSSSSSIPQLNQIEPIKLQESVIKPTAEEPQILNLMSLQPHCVSQVSHLNRMEPSSSSLVLNTSGNSVLFQVCGSHLASHSSNEVLSSDAVAVSQLSGISLTTNELSGYRLQPPKTNPVHSLLSNTDKGHIQVQSTQSSPLFKSSLCPIFVGHSNKSCTDDKIQIRVAPNRKNQSRSCTAIQSKPSPCPIAPCKIKSPVRLQFPSGHSVPNYLINPIKISSSPRELNSTCPAVVVQTLAPSVQILGKSEVPVTSSLHVQRVDSCELRSAPIIPSERKSQNCMSNEQSLLCFGVKQSSFTNSKTERQDHKGRQSRQLNSYSAAAENPIFVQPLLVEHSKIVPVRPDVILKNVKSTRRGRQKRSPIKERVPVPIQPKILPKSQNDIEVQISVNDCLASNVAHSLQLPVISCDMKSYSQNSCIQMHEYPRADSQIQTFKSSDVPSDFENCIAFNSLDSNSTIHGQIIFKSSNELSQLSSSRTSKKRSSSETSTMNKFQKKFKTVVVSPSNQKLLRQKNIEISLPICRSAVKTVSDTVSSSQSLLPKPACKTSVNSWDLVNTHLQSATVLCKDEVVDGIDSQVSAKRLLLKRNTSCQKSENDTLILELSNTSKWTEANSSCNSVLFKKARRKNLALTLNETSQPANSVTVKIADCLNETFESDSSSNVLQLQEETPRFVPILPRPTNNHMCIFSQAVGHKGRPLWDYLFKKKLARKIRHNLSVPRQRVDKNRRQKSMKTNSKEIFHNNS